MKAFASLILLLTAGCASTPERVNLVDGKPVKKESWFNFRVEREQLEPQDERYRTLENLSRKR
jgi:hypothetical protein